LKAQKWESKVPKSPFAFREEWPTVIIGGRTGIGAATAYAFAEAGASRIAILGRRKHLLLETKTRIEQDFPDIEVFIASTDIGNKE
jgi:NADP-dependent 3-hydroxy acid dehydrogenase YdfG